LHKNICFVVLFRGEGEVRWTTKAHADFMGTTTNFAVILRTYFQAEI